MPPTLPSFTACSQTKPFDFSKRSTPESLPPRLTFREYLEPAWEVIEPAARFVGGYHVDAIAEHLQALSEGLLQNLLINIPPRHTKSTLVCVLWPTWEWTFAPWLQWMFASYREALAIRDSIKCRRLILSRWYQERWGSVYRLTDDQNQKTRFENDRTGYRLALGVGTGTGEGGHRLVADDPLSAKQGESDAYREAANDWIDTTFSTRGNDPRTVARVIVMQRLHDADVTGHVLERMREGGTQYDHLVLPAEYEPRAQLCMAGLVHDPRTEPDALLSPERFDARALAQLKADLGDDAPGQLQQRPTPPGGAIFQSGWWAGTRNRYDAEALALPDAPIVVGRWLFFDTAFKKGEENDWTACSVLELLADYRLRVREVWKRKVEFPALLTSIESSAAAWVGDGLLQGISIEDKGSGTSAYQTLKAGAPDWLARLLRTFMPQGSKEYRARQASQWCARDCILLPQPSPVVPWLFDFEQSLEKFPRAAHDDDVDTFTQGILYLEHYIARGWRARGGRLEAVA
jgi:predicted phage terminase large subunit-like protein